MKCHETRWNDGKFWTPAHIDRRGYHWPFELGRCPMTKKAASKRAPSGADFVPYGDLL